jgi:CDP-glycerol glycerophosphotransferase
MILFAPTFRDNFTTSTYDIKFDSILDVLNNTSGEKWVFLVRLHPNISEKASLLGFFKDTVINASDYDDMQELLYASDILITDYSDCMFEFALSGKPLFLYFEDIANYRKERDLYLDLFSAPFPVAQTIDDLILNIKNFNGDGYLRKVNTALKQIDFLNDGKASQRVVDRIIKEIGG